MLLISHSRREKPLRHERQLEVIDDPVHYGIVREEGHDAHSTAALMADYRVDFINLADHLSPAAAGDLRAVLLEDQELLLTLLRLTHFAPVGIGIEAILC